MKRISKNIKTDYQPLDHISRMVAIHTDSALSGAIHATIWRGIDIKRLKYTKRKGEKMDPKILMEDITELSIAFQLASLAEDKEAIKDTARDLLEACQDITNWIDRGGS